MTDDLNWIFTDKPIETSDGFDVPVVMQSEAANRIFINGLKKQALNQLVPVLPPPDAEVYIISNGAGAEKKWKPGGVDNLAFDFGTFIPHLIDLFGVSGVEAHISTWTMNRNHALGLLEALQDGRIARLTLFTDPYFIRREPAVHNLLAIGFKEYGERVRYLAFKNHCKLVCLKTTDERVVTVSGSANLSAQPRCEQYNLTTHRAVYEFYVGQFFNVMWSNVNAG